ncbi:protein-glutamine glutaminase family protein [Kitasatospora sp. NPDC056800]|uniref:protein-glutamine glutaminase family protein n=1 Tax=Kitasatospora sp. NPDC056800 TaxID=3345948 RepID=UPI0036C59F0A
MNRRKAADEASARGARVSPAGGLLAANTVPALQRTIGNAAVTRLLARQRYAADPETGAKVLAPTVAGPGAAIQRMMPAGGRGTKREAEDEIGGRSNRQRVEGEPSADVDSSSESSQSSRSSTPALGLGPEAKNQLDDELTDIMQKLEDYDNGSRDEEDLGETVAELGDRQSAYSMLRNLVPITSVNTVDAVTAFMTARVPADDQWLAALTNLRAELQGSQNQEAPTADFVKDLWPIIQELPSVTKLSPEADECEKRAHDICQALAGSHPEVANRHLFKHWAMRTTQTPIHPSYGWRHHVAATVVVEGGQQLVLDPFLFRDGPVPLSSWEAEMTGPKSVYRVAWEFRGAPGADGQPDQNSAMEFS